MLEIVEANECHLYGDLLAVDSDGQQLAVFRCLDDAKLFVRAKTFPDAMRDAAYAADLARIRELESTMFLTADGPALVHPDDGLLPKPDVILGE